MTKKVCKFGAGITGLVFQQSGHAIISRYKKRPSDMTIIFWFSKGFIILEKVWVGYSYKCLSEFLSLTVEGKKLI